MLEVRRNCIERGAESDMMWIASYTTLIDIWLAERDPRQVTIEQHHVFHRRIGRDSASQCIDHKLFDRRRSNTPDRSRLRLTSSQQRRTHIKSVTHTVLAGKARAHAISLVIVEFAEEQGTAFRSFCDAAARFGSEELLDPVKGRAVDDSLVLAREPLAGVVNLAEINPVLEKVREETVGEGDATVILDYLGRTSLRDNTSPVEVRDQLAEGLQFEGIGGK